MKLLITGAAGQLGRALVEQFADRHEVVALGRNELDVTSRDDIDRRVARVRPDWVINAAAWTAVDSAEQEQDAARRVNADAPAWLAESCARHHARLLHFSTDFVFSGNQSTPYSEKDAPDPRSVYGSTKLAGERSALSAGDAVILRTAWLYSHGAGNFVSTMLKLHRHGAPFSVVFDQVGSPTWVGTVAESAAALINKGPASGIYHCADAGIASRYDLAVAVGEEALALGLLSNVADVTDIRTAEYPLPASRPAYSVLDCSRLRHELQLDARHWRHSLRLCLRRIADG